MRRLGETRDALGNSFPGSIPSCSSALPTPHLGSASQTEKKNNEEHDPWLHFGAKKTF